MAITKELYVCTDGLSYGQSLKITRDLLASDYFGTYEILTSKNNCIRFEGDWFENKDLVPPALLSHRAVALKSFQPKILYSIEREIEDNGLSEENIRLEFYMQGNYGHKLFISNQNKDAISALEMSIELKIEPSEEHCTPNYHKISLIHVPNESIIHIPDSFGMNAGDFCHRYNGWLKKLRTNFEELLKSNEVEDKEIISRRPIARPVEASKVAPMRRLVGPASLDSFF